MLDIRKMERPHRSGVLAIAVAYSLLYIAVDFTNLGNLGDGTWKDLVLCHLVPMACIDLPTKQIPQPQPEYSVTRLVYCPTCKVKRKQEGECRELGLTKYGDYPRPVQRVQCPSYAAFDRWIIAYKYDEPLWITFDFDPAPPQWELR